MEYMSVPLPGTRSIQEMFCPKLVHALHSFHTRIGENKIAVSFPTKNIGAYNALSCIIFRSDDSAALNDFKDNEAKSALTQLNLPTDVTIQTEEKPHPTFRRLRLDRLSPSRLSKKVDFQLKKDDSKSREQVIQELREYHSKKYREIVETTPFLALKFNSGSNGHLYRLNIAWTDDATKLDSFGLYKSFN